MVSPNKKALVLIYNSLELFPPTLNALEFLSSKFIDIDTISTKPLSKSSWQYPNNVTNYYSHFKNSGFISNLKNYLNFLRITTKLLKSEKYDLVLIYDGITLGLLFLIFNRLRKINRVWYHNHDVFDIKHIKAFSITNLLRIAEQIIIKKVDIISFPAQEREAYFLKSKANKIVLPNYPYLRIGDVENCKKLNTSDEIKIIYQGRISVNHGIEELLEFLSKISQLNISVTIIGFIKPDYLRNLKQLILKLKLSDKVTLKKSVPYEKLKKITQEHHIGWAVIKPSNIAYATAGTASNKIYEYMSCGMPVIYFDCNHYNKYLQELSWSFSTDLTHESLNQCLDEISNNYEFFSKIAISDFEQKFNFQKEYDKIKLI